MRDSEQIRNEIEEKFGFFPPFFEPALGTPEVLENLWQQTLVAYVNNPVPALFKERLFAYLSRYCSVPYCIVCHSCALRPLGARAKAILRMLEKGPPPGEESLKAHMQMLVELGTLQQWPLPGSQLDQAVFRLCETVFLMRPGAQSCVEVLRQALEASLYAHLIAFLAYIKTCFAWVEAYPELSYEADERARQHLQPLLEEEPALAVFFLQYQERIRQEQADRETQLAHYLGRREAGLKHLEEQTSRCEALYEREHRITKTLQRSFLPERLPECQGAILAARYCAGSLEVDVGGDWYDVIALPKGRLMLIVGDVVGRGLQAATTMGQLRNTLRAYALEEFSPATSLDRLNSLVMTLGGSGRSTVLCLSFYPTQQLVRIANAGHLPPLLLRPDGTAEYLDDGGSVPIGVLDDPVYVEDYTTLEPGSTLLLFTDGLVESRRRTLGEGLTQLAQAAVQGPQNLEELLDHILNEVAEEQPDDDIALLALRVVSSPPRLRLRFPAKPEVLAQLRRNLRSYLTRLGVSDEEIYEITVACSEAAANAIEHAQNPTEDAFEVDAGVEEGQLAIVVRDFGDWRPPAPQSKRGRGMRLMTAFTQVKVQQGTRGSQVIMRRRLARETLWNRSQT
jgi:serine phosphatase RsbU (regulator of sigma subunit)/anti-sigma regulatory factor (Ser/Thr protein kinase)